MSAQASKDDDNDNLGLVYNLCYLYILTKHNFMFVTEIHND